jgi:hypothetical protein
MNVISQYWLVTSDRNVILHYVFFHGHIHDNLKSGARKPALGFWYYLLLPVIFVVAGHNYCMYWLVTIGEILYLLILITTNLDPINDIYTWQINQNHLLLLCHFIDCQKYRVDKCTTVVYPTIWWCKMTAEKCDGAKVKQKRPSFFRGVWLLILDQRSVFTPLDICDATDSDSCAFVIDHEFIIYLSPRSRKISSSLLTN